MDKNPAPGNDTPLEPAPSEIVPARPIDPRQQAVMMLDALGYPTPDMDGLDAALIPEDMGEDDVDERLGASILGSNRIFDGGFLHIDEVELEMPNGDVVTHEVLRHPGAVAIIAVNEAGQVLLVRQWRTTLERVTLEIPAGKLEPGEDPQDCALRELQEETGYTAGSIRYLIPVACAAGYSDEIIHIYLASNLQPGLAHPDQDEFVEPLWMDLSELVDMVLDGRIEDSKTIIGALAWDAIASRL